MRRLASSLVAESLRCLRAAVGAGGRIHEQTLRPDPADAICSSAIAADLAAQTRKLGNLRAGQEAGACPDFPDPPDPFPRRVWPSDAARLAANTPRADAGKPFRRSSVASGASQHWGAPQWPSRSERWQAECQHAYDTMVK